MCCLCLLDVVFGLSFVGLETKDDILDKRGYTSYIISLSDRPL